MEPSEGSIWSPKQDKAFEKGLVLFPEKCIDRFEKISAIIPGQKSAEDVRQHYQKFLDDLAALEAQRLVLSYTNNPSTSLIIESSPNDNNYSTLHTFGSSASNAAEPSIKDSGKDRAYKRGNPWTELEHKSFLLGIQRHGKGEWKTVAKDYVKTRTSSQVASHAQKFFKKKKIESKFENRCSIFDLSHQKDKDAVHDIDDDDEQLEVNDAASYFNSPGPKEDWSLNDIFAPSNDQAKLEVNCANGSTNSSAPIIPPSTDQPQAKIYNANGDASYAPLSRPDERRGLLNITTSNAQGEYNINDANTNHATPRTNESRNIATDNDQGKLGTIYANGITSYVTPSTNGSWSHNNIIPSQGQTKNNDATGRTKHATLSPNERCSIIDLTTPDGQPKITNDAYGLSSHATPNPIENWSHCDGQGQPRDNGANRRTKHATSPNERCSIIDLTTPNVQGQPKINDVNGITSYATASPNERWSLLNIPAPNGLGQFKINDANGITKHATSSTNGRWGLLNDNTQGHFKFNDANGSTSYALPTPNGRWGLYNAVPPLAQAQHMVYNGYTSYIAPRPDIWSLSSIVPPNVQAHPQINDANGYTNSAKLRPNERWSPCNIMPTNPQVQPRSTNDANGNTSYVTARSNERYQAQPKINDTNGNTGHASPIREEKWSLFDIIQPYLPAQTNHEVNTNTDYSRVTPNEAPNGVQTVNNVAPSLVINQAPMINNEAQLALNEAPMMINGTPLVIIEPSDTGNIVVTQQWSPSVSPCLGGDYDALMDPAFQEVMSKFPSR